MQNDIVLFWIVLAGLLFIDNFVLVPRGGDYLKFGRTGRLNYAPGTRLQARGRDMVLLNPLNPYDRLALTKRSIGPLTPDNLRSSQKLVRDTLGAINLLSLVGSGYLIVLLLLAVLSMWAYFGLVLAFLAGAHVLAWSACLTVIAKHRQVLRLSRPQAFSLSAEALLVPGYLVNLGKRVWLRQSLDLPALTLGLWQLRRMPVDSARELYADRLARRLDDVAFELSLEDASAECESAASEPTQSPLRVSTPPAGQFAPSSPTSPQPQQVLEVWLTNARRCLTTLVPPAGL